MWGLRGRLAAIMVPLLAAGLFAGCTKGGPHDTRSSAAPRDAAPQAATTADSGNDAAASSGPDTSGVTIEGSDGVVALRESQLLDSVEKGAGPGKSVITPAEGMTLLWVVARWTGAESAPTTLNLHEIKAEDTAGNRYPLTAVGIGAGAPDSPSVDHLIAAANLEGEPGALVVPLMTDVTHGGPEVGKARVEIEGESSAKLTFIETPATFALLFVVPSSTSDLVIRGISSQSSSR